MDRDAETQSVSADTLVRCRFFDRLGYADRRYVARYVRSRQYPAGAEIAGDEDVARPVYFIERGTVLVSHRLASGTATMYQELHQGEMFGALSALDGIPDAASAKCIEDTRLLWLPARDFQHVVLRFPELAQQTMLRLCALTRFYCGYAMSTRSLTVPEQIRLEIWRIVSSRLKPDQGAGEIGGVPTHGEIARCVGASREQVTRVMGELAQAGLIEQAPSAWRVPSIAMLRNASPRI